MAGKALQQLQEIVIRKGLLEGQADGQLTPATQKALRNFTGNENFEERCDLRAGWMDKPVYDYLVKKFGQ